MCMFWNREFKKCDRELGVCGEGVGGGGGWKKWFCEESMLNRGWRWQERKREV